MHGDINKNVNIQHPLNTKHVLTIINWLFNINWLTRKHFKAVYISLIAISKFMCSLNKAVLLNFAIKSTYTYLHVPVIKTDLWYNK